MNKVKLREDRGGDLRQVERENLEGNALPLQMHHQCMANAFQLYLVAFENVLKSLRGISTFSGATIIWSRSASSQNARVWHCKCNKNALLMHSTIPALSVTPEPLEDQIKCK